MYLREDVVNNRFNIEYMPRVRIPQSYKCTSELIESFIRKAGRPLLWSEIIDMYYEIYPNGYLNRQKISSLAASSEKILHIGRESIYTLSEWTDTRRGGTIKGFSIEFLSHCPEKTSSLSELAEYIHKFRPSSSPKSIADNLRLDPFKQFQIFSKNMKRYVKLVKIVDSVKGYKIKED